MNSKRIIGWVIGEAVDISRCATGSASYRGCRRATAATSDQTDKKY